MQEDLNYTSEPINYLKTELKYYDYGAQKRPIRSKPTDAGLDVHFYGLRNEKGELDQKVQILMPQQVLKVPLGFGVGVPYGTMGLIKPRSGHSILGIIPLEAPIDTGYTGEVHAMITNLSDVPYVLEVGERIAQLVIQPIITSTTWVYTEPSTVKSQRGTQAHGSSGLF